MRTPTLLSVLRVPLMCGALLALGAPAIAAVPDSPPVQPPGQAQAPALDERLGLARHLYVCSKFYLGMAKTTEGDKQKRARDLGLRYMLEATKDVVDVDEDPRPENTELARQYSKLSQQDLDEFMQGLSEQSDEERVQRMQQFMGACTVADLQWKLRGPLKVAKRGDQAGGSR